MIDMKQLYGAEDELPLETLASLPADGGFTGIFRKIGVIGDSLSSGEFQAVNELGANTYHDMFDYSWGKYLSRMAGCDVSVCSRGGMTAREFVSGFADQKGYWDELYTCDAVIIALGVNDVSQMQNGTETMGNVSEFDPNAMWANKSFVYCYAHIIEKIKNQNPFCHFFLVTIPREADTEQCELHDEHRLKLQELCGCFERTYLIDLRTYAPAYDEEFRRRFFMAGHMNPAGYLLTAKFMAGYIDYIVRHNPEKFHQLGFNHSPIRHPQYFK